MTTLTSSPHLRRFRGCAWLLAAGLALAACASPAASPAASVASSSPSGSAVGPTTFAAWTERQGFGGTSGLLGIEKAAEFLANTEIETFDIDYDAQIPIALAAWLDSHPPTDCWAEYHAAVRAELATVIDGYASARAEVAAGRPVPAEAITQVRDAAVRATALEAPADCP